MTPATTVIIVMLLLLMAVAVAPGSITVPFFSPDRTERIAQAIAGAEGYYVAGSLPQRLNNPGALKLDGRNLTSFVTSSEGWGALYRQVDLILSNLSSIYSSSMSIQEIARIYTGGDNPESWAYNVSGFLGVSPDTPIGAV